MASGDQSSSRVRCRRVPRSRCVEAPGFFVERVSAEPADGEALEAAGSLAPERIAADGELGGPGQGNRELGFADGFEWRFGRRGLCGCGQGAERKQERRRAGGGAASLGGVAADDDGSAREDALHLLAAELVVSLRGAVGHYRRRAGA